MVRIRYTHINNNINELNDDDDEIIYYNDKNIKKNIWNRILLTLINLFCGKYYTKFYNNKTF